MKEKKSGLSHIMQEVWPSIYRRDGERPTREDEQTPLGHKTMKTE